MPKALKIVLALTLVGVTTLLALAYFVVQSIHMESLTNEIEFEFRQEIGADENFDFSNLDCEITVNNNDNSLLIDCVDPTKALDNERPQTSSQTDQN